MLAPNPSPRIVTRKFADDGSVPNNPALPLVIYCGALPSSHPDLAAGIEELYRHHAWGGAWRWSVYDFHHYHSNAHECLGVFRGQARVQFGGGKGEAFDVAVGDVIIIPAGVGHKRLSSSDDFQVVGGYPRGQAPDMNRGEPAERPKVLEAIKKVPAPKEDPIYGKEGPLMRLWRA